MKVFVICFLITTFSSFISIANSKNSINLKETADLFLDDDFSFRNIFFTDTENNILFIDFEVIEDHLIKVNLRSDNDLVMNDNVSNLSSDTIYEIDLNAIKEGVYTIELVTDSGFKIQKEIIID